MSDQKPVKAYVFGNGMLMVFDAAGQQVPDWQGEASEKLEALKKAFPGVRVEKAVYFG